MANTFKKVIDRQMWVQVPPAPNATGAATCVCSDLRSDVSRNPFVYQMVSATVLNRFNIVSKAWNFVQSPALAGTFGAGAAMVFAPSQGLKGVLAAGATTSSVVVSTAFPTAVGLNMLANRGGSGEYGFNIRIIGKACRDAKEGARRRKVDGAELNTKPDIAHSFAVQVVDREGLSNRIQVQATYDAVQNFIERVAHVVAHGARRRREDHAIVARRHRHRDGRRRSR